MLNHVASRLTHRVVAKMESLNWRASAREIFRSTDEQLASASAALVARVASPKVAKRVSSMRGLRWSVLSTIVACVLLTLWQFSAGLSGGGLDDDETDLEAPGGFTPQRRRQRTQAEADAGASGSGKAWDVDVLDEDDPLLRIGEEGGGEEAAATRPSAIRSRGWAVTQGVPLKPLTSWRWHAMDPGCAIDRMAAPSAAYAELLPDSWEHFVASGRRIVFPPPGKGRSKESPAGRQRSEPDSGAADEEEEEGSELLPALSVITIMRDKGAETYPMVRAMHQQAWEVSAAGTATIEFILVDNASEDPASLQLMAALTNAAVLRMGRNAHWAGGNNGGMGCRSAASTTTLFWNNDAVPLKGTLAEYVRMSRTIQRSAIGAVGCALQYPDGRLQEAGSIIWGNGGAMGYGRDARSWRVLPRFIFRRAVDYVSGACLAVRNDVLQATRGIDEKSYTAYYEDTDLQMRIRNELGLSIIYDPLLVATHQVSLSYGPGGSKTLMDESRPVFMSRWAGALLASHVPPPRGRSLANAYCARDRRPGLRILIMDDAVKPAHFGSGYGRARHLHLALARLGHMVTLFPWFDGERYESNSELVDAGVEVVHHSVAWEDQGGREVVFRAWADDDRPNGYDLIIISRPHTWKACHGLARSMFPHAPIFYDSEAIIAGRELGMALYRKAKPGSLLFQSAAAAERAEVEILMQADAVIVVSEGEAENARALLHHNSLDARAKSLVTFAVAYPVALEPGVKPFVTPAEQAQRTDIVFLGAFRPPTSRDLMVYNGDAAYYFVKHVLPLVRKKLSPERSPFVIAGRDAPPQITGLAKPGNAVTVLGYVDDLASLFSKARIMVVPHTYAAGIPIKAFDAASYNVPIVISATGNVGLRGTEDIGIIPGGGTPAEMAATIVSLLTDNERHARAVTALGRFRQKYSLAAFEASVAAMMRTVKRSACTWTQEEREKGAAVGNGKASRKRLSGGG